MGAFEKIQDCIVNVNSIWLRLFVAVACQLNNQTTYNYILI